MARMSTPGQRDLEELTTYLNNQPDALVAIVKSRTSWSGETGDLHILTFDPEGKHVSLALWPPGKKEQKIEIPFDPPLKRPFDARPRLLAMRDEAFRKYGVIPYYVFPPLIPYLLPIILAMSVIVFALYGWGTYADTFRAWILRNFGRGMLPGAKWFMIITHIFEAGYMVWAMPRHRVPLIPAIQWVLTTVAVGFPAVNELWECVQYERLRVIYRKTDVGEIPPRVPESGKKKAE